MGSFSIWHWIIVLVIVLLLFGAGKLPNVMGDIAKGVKAFKAGMKDEDETAPPATTTASTQAPPAAIHPAPAQPAADPVTTAPASVTPVGQPHPVDPAKPHQG
ncbi:twin-arginine translocase TatA/TatE family subunit [Azospirillum sp. TSO35-2]|uniref:twin-arginine translocase TatA/TatE family subunit n=1 Tax=Azospirillum sp. TSO35-2 TaxID=716796 RepID=UPI000D612AE5|nr:twin-arginine translocase TatA/TatE family subunit [Azospirillum sp. TSO35-2]PWC39102.1 preprotein translocase [Azospirillum sp. TSO35-2]